MAVHESINLIHLPTKEETTTLLKENHRLLEMVNSSLTPIEAELQQINSAFLFFTPDSHLLCLSSSLQLKSLLSEYDVVVGGKYSLSEYDYYNQDAGLNISLRRLNGADNFMLGYLCVVSLSEDFKTCRVLLKSLSVAIEREFINRQMHLYLEESNQYAFAIMNNLSSAVITIDLNDRIHWINDTACRILNIRRTKLINESIDEYFFQWSKVKRIINSGLNFTDEECRFEKQATHSNFLFNAYPIKSLDKLLIGFILTFRSYSRAFQTMEKLRGMQARYRFEDIICASKIMIQAVNYARSIAKNSSTVLIEGDSGTGKEVFAQSIHNASERAHQPFVAVNCGAISPTLIEAELFGYEEGAFTGAQKGGRSGKFEQANGGTLFLDEIGEMPLEMQVKLLRSLQEKNVTRVGSAKAIPVDVRIISATNRNLEEEVSLGRFRNDLYFRLNVLPIRIPSLRERGDDIIPLFNHLLQIKSEKFNKPLPFISKELEDKIKRYEWPGNVRELENFCERLIIVGEKGLNAISTAGVNRSEDISALNESSPTIRETIPLEQLEKEAISQALIKEEYNLTHTAQKLGIGRNTLYAKIRKYGLAIRSNSLVFLTDK